MDDQAIRLLLILGNSKPIYYLGEILITRHHLIKCVDNRSIDIFFPIIQIAKSDVLDSHIEYSIEELLSPGTVYVGVQDYGLFEEIRSIMAEFNRNARHIKAGLIRQALKTGRCNVYIHYFFIKRNPSSYETLDTLIRSIINYAGLRKTIYLYILVFTREAESTYNAYAELLNVLGRYRTLNGFADGIFNINNNINIRIIKAGLIGPEEVFLSGLHDIFLDSFFKKHTSIHPYTWISPRIPIYDLASELTISYIRSLASGEFKVHKREEGAGIYHVCLPNTPVSLLPVLYNVEDYSNNKETMAFDYRVLDKETIIIPDLLFSTYHRCPRYRLGKSIHSRGPVRGANWSVNYIFRGIIVFREIQKIKDVKVCKEPYECIEGIKKFLSGEKAYVVVIGKTTNNINSTSNHKRNSPKECPDRRICIVSTIRSNLNRKVFREHFGVLDLSKIKPLYYVKDENGDEKFFIILKRIKKSLGNTEDKEYVLRAYKPTGRNYPVYVWACLRGFDNWREDPSNMNVPNKDPLLALLESFYPIEPLSLNTNNKKYVLSLEMHGCIAGSRSYDEITLAKFNGTIKNGSAASFLNRLLFIPLSEQATEKAYSILYNYVKEIILKKIKDSTKDSYNKYKIFPEKSNNTFPGILIYKEWFNCDETHCPLMRFRPYIITTASKDYVEKKVKEMCGETVSKYISEVIRPVFLKAYIDGNPLIFKYILGDLSGDECKKYYLNNDFDNRLKGVNIKGCKYLIRTEVKINREYENILKTLYKIAFGVKIKESELINLLGKIKVQGISRSLKDIIEDHKLAEIHDVYKFINYDAKKIGDSLFGSGFRTFIDQLQESIDAFYKQIINIYNLSVIVDLAEEMGIEDLKDELNPEYRDYIGSVNFQKIKEVIGELLKGNKTELSITEIERIYNSILDVLKDGSMHRDMEFIGARQGLDLFYWLLERFLEIIAEFLQFGIFVKGPAINIQESDVSRGRTRLRSLCDIVR